MVVQQAKREIILAGKRCWHSLVMGMMLCSEGKRTNKLSYMIASGKQTSTQLTVQP